MAVLTAKGISRVNVELLTRSLVLPMTVTRIPGAEFAGSNGDTITVRVPQPGSARKQATRGADITYDDVTEVPVDVTLAHLYHGKLVSDEEMSLDIENFARQVSRIQVDAVATGAEDELATVMNALAADFTFAATATDADTKGILQDARETLTRNKAPLSDRFLSCSPEVVSRLIDVEDFSRADATGDGRSSAIRDAIVGRIYGFTVVESAGLDAGEAVAYHRSGFVFANRVPVRPRGAVDSATATAGGIGVRHIFQYEPGKLSDASVVSTFGGAAAVDEGDDVSSNPIYKRFVKLASA